MSEPEHIEETRDALHSLRDELKDAVVGREVLCNRIVLALTSQEHILIRGKHGEAKSLLAEKVGEATDLNTFTQQIHRETRTKHIAGMLDLEKYEDDSELDIIETEFFSSHILHFDEFLRGTDEFQDLLLEVMEERRFTKSYKDDVDLPVLSVIATTNPLTNAYNTGSMDSALLSRFAFIQEVDHLVETGQKRNLGEAIEVTDEDLEVGFVSVSADDIREFKQYALDNVEYNTELISSLAKGLESQDIAIDTRFWRKYRQVVQVYHLLEGYHEPQDTAYSTVAMAMLTDRFKSLDYDTLEEELDDAVLRARYADDLDDIEEIRQIDEPHPFVQRAVRKVQELDDENDRLPQSLRNEVDIMEQNIENKAMMCLDKLEPSTVRELDTERFSTVRKTYVDNHMVKTRMVAKKSPERDVVQDILDAYVNEAEVVPGDEAGKFMHYEVKPSLDSDASFDEVVTVRNKFEEEDLNHVG